MCITTPAEVLEINGKIAKVRINGKISQVRIDLVKARVGDYVYCASGMAVERVDR